MPYTTYTMPSSMPESLEYTKRRLTQLADFIVNPDAPEILAEGSVHPIRAMVINAVLLTPGMPAFISRYSTVQLYRRAGFSVLGSGYHAITTEDGPESVRKFYPRTGLLEASAQQALLDSWRKRQALTAQHMGSYFIPQLFSIEQDPLHPDRSLISAAQQRVYSKGAISIRAINAAPHIARDFLEASYSMQAESAPEALPDLVGRDNAVVDVTTGMVKLIDPIPLIRSDPVDQLGFIKTERFIHHALNGEQ